MSLSYEDQDTGETLYFEHTYDGTKSPPVWVCVVTTRFGGDRHQIGPIELVGATEEARDRECHALIMQVLGVYQVPIGGVRVHH